MDQRPQEVGMADSNNSTERDLKNYLVINWEVRKFQGFLSNNIGVLLLIDADAST